MTEQFWTRLFHALSVLCLWGLVWAIVPKASDWTDWEHSLPRAAALALAAFAGLRFVALLISLLRRVL